MLRDFLLAIGGTTVLVAIWTATQWLARRQLPGSQDELDVPVYGVCCGSGPCHCGAAGGAPKEERMDRETPLR